MSESLHALARKLRLPVLCAPMSLVSGTALVSAACRAGIIGSFPTHNAPDGELGRWIAQIRERIADSPDAGPLAVNLIVHRTYDRLQKDLRVLMAHPPDLVITSVGSPTEVVRPLQEAGCIVLADVGNLRHAERCAAAGVDGLVLLTAGSGGQTGWANPFAYVRAVRNVTDVPIVLAGGISDGAGIWSALTLGCTLVSMGTRFLATRESSASPRHKEIVCAAGLDDITLMSEVSGLPASFVRKEFSLRFLTPAERDTALAVSTEPENGFRFDSTISSRTPWQSAGQSVSGVNDIPSVSDLVDLLEADVRVAMERTRGLLDATATRRGAG